MTAWLVALLLLLLGQEAPPAGVPAEGGSSEAEALVARIRESLSAIDDALLETADADDVSAALGEIAAAHERVVRDLEELIKQAKYRSGKSGSGGGGGQQPSGSSQDSGQPPPRQSDGSQAPDPQQDGAPQPDQQEQAGQQQQGEQPQDVPPPGADPGRDRAASGPPPPDPLGDPTRASTDGRWGLLPPKVQERLLNLHVDDVPERYRDWLSAYVRALSAEEGRSGGGGR